LDGEKTLSSLAFVFALHYYKPSPLYVMDETDAALPLPSQMSPLWDVTSRYVTEGKEENVEVDHIADISQILLQNYIST
jgi:hypothetical protein